MAIFSGNFDQYDISIEDNAIKVQKGSNIDFLYDIEKLQFADSNKVVDKLLTLKTPTNATLTANLKNLILTGKDNINGTGNKLDNTIRGNKGNNILKGLAGNDNLKSDWQPRQRCP